MILKVIIFFKIIIFLLYFILLISKFVAEKNFLRHEKSHIYII